MISRKIPALVLAAIALPSVVSARDSYHLQLAADAIRQQLYLCRQRALVANQMCSIKISATGRSRNATNAKIRIGVSAATKSCGRYWPK